MNSISPKQREFATRLLSERVHDLGPDYAEWTLETLTSREASNLIETLLVSPRKPSPLDDVPAGRYAVEIDGVLGFFKVDKPKPPSRWAGHTFVKQQASDEEYPVRGARASLVLAVILPDPMAAMLAYGREIGSCGHCGRTLTDDASRAAGIGPVCAGKMGI